MEISVSVQGDAPSLNADPALRRAHQRIARLGTAAARMYGSRHSRSGEMVAELRSRVMGAEGVEWYDPAPQALFLEEGTPAHIITPKNRKALRWFGPSGQPIFARRVEHPGTSAEPWLEPAIRDNTGVFEDIYASEIAAEFG